MTTNPLILNAQALKRLPVPDTAVGQMPSVNPIASLNASPLSALATPSLPPMASPVPALGPAPMPSVLKAPDPTTQNTKLRLLGDQTELKRLGDTGSGVSQIKSPLLRGLARVGDVAESILAPGAAAFTPGTTLNHQRLVGQQEGYVNNDLANQKEQAATDQSDAMANYLEQRPAIEQSKIDQKQTAVQQRVGQAAAARGQLVSWDENGIPTFTDDHNSQAFADNQALALMHQTTADKNAVLTDIQKNHYIPGTPEFDEAQRKLAQIDKRQQVALASLGIRAQGLDLRRQNTNAALYGTDNAGNALPGSAQITGDDGNPTTVGAKFAPNAIKQQKNVGSFNDLSGSVSHARNTLTQFFKEGGSLSDPMIVAAMSDPNSTVGKVINGKLIQGGLSSSAISAINAVRQLHEQAGILRSTTGGTSSEAGAQRILDVVPTAGDANAVALNKLDEQDNVLRRLSPGQTSVSGGLSVRHPGSASPETKTYQGHTYVKGPSGWHLQQ